MNRHDRLRQQVPGADEELIEKLALLPRDQVDQIVAALRQARRDGVAADRSRRRQRRDEARRYHWYDEAQLADRNRRVVSAHGRRAQADLEALGSLAELREHIDGLIRLAVTGLHARGHSDTEIAAALGITRQGVWKTYLRQPESADGPDSCPAEA